MCKNRFDVDDLVSHWSKKLMRLLSALAFLPLLSGCPSGPTSISWTEEVKLHDGRIITIARKAEREWGGELGRRGMPLWWEINYQSPSVPPISWHEDKAATPYIFDIYKGIPYLAAETALSPACQKYGYPVIGFVFFKYEKSEWRQISYEEFPPDIDTNLLVNAWHQASIGKLDRRITIAEKNDMQKPPYHFRSVRKVIETGEKLCDGFRPIKQQ